MKGVEQSPPHTLDVWEHTLHVLGHLENVITLVISNTPKGDAIFDQMLVESLGQYREAFIEHYSKSLNTDRTTRAILFLSTLYHDIEKPATKIVEESGRIRFFDHEIQGEAVAEQRAYELKLSNDEIERIKKIVRHHMRFHSFSSELAAHRHPPSRRALYRFFQDAKDAALDLILLGLADVRGTYENNLSRETWRTSLEVAAILLENYWKKPNEVVSPPSLLDGNVLMRELHLEPGRIVGLILEAIREAQAAGDVSNRDEALAFAAEEYSRLKNILDNNGKDKS